MNPIEFLAHFVNVLMACSALVVTETNLNHKTYLIQEWICQTSGGPVQVRLYSSECHAGSYKYWNRANYIKVGETACYINQFGEVYCGEGAQVDQAYTPNCGD